MQRKKQACRQPAKQAGRRAGGRKADVCEPGQPQGLGWGVNEFQGEGRCEEEFGGAALGALHSKRLLLLQAQPLPQKRVFFFPVPPSATPFLRFVASAFWLTSNWVCLLRPPPSHHSAVCAQRLVDEIAAHKHHLQDAAQYALGNLMAMVLGDTRVSPAQRQRHVSRLMEELRKTNTPGQCQGAFVGQCQGAMCIAASRCESHVPFFMGWPCSHPKNLPPFPGPSCTSPWTSHLSHSSAHQGAWGLFIPSHLPTVLPPFLPSCCSGADRAELHRGEWAGAQRHGALPRAAPAHGVWAAHRGPPPPCPQPLPHQGAPAGPALPHGHAGLLF